MKLLKFNAANMRQRGSNPHPCLVMHRKTSNNLNMPAVEALGVKAGDTVSFCQDEEHPEDWYMVVNDPEGFKLRESTGLVKALLFNNVAMANTMLDALGLENAYYARFRIQTEPQELEGGGVKAYLILTASAEVKEYAPPQDQD